MYIFSKDQGLHTLLSQTHIHTPHHGDKNSFVKRHILGWFEVLVHLLWIRPTNLITFNMFCCCSCSSSILSFHEVNKRAKLIPPQSYSSQS